MLLEVNGESVRHTSHTDLVTMLKRCPKGNQTNFLVLAGMYIHTYVPMYVYTRLLHTVRWVGLPCWLTTQLFLLIICSFSATDFK